MSVRTKIYLSESHDPWFNLATETWMFEDFDDADQVLFLWQNQPTVVIGRSQNPWLECHLEKMQQDDVKLARRQSGGGAVFHDLGNTNFTFLSKKPNYSKQRNLNVIIEALRTCGVESEFSGRNDLVTCEQQPRKISGSAFKEKADRAFHHGTLLINADLMRLGQYLNPSKKKLEAKGITSVRSRVVNMTELNPAITHELVCEQIIEQFRQTYQSEVDIELLSVDRLHAIDSLQQRYQQLQSWDWLYGQTLPFTHHFDHRFDWGTVDVQLVVKQAVIEQAKIYTDALQPEWLEAYAQALQGQTYHPDSICQVTKVIRRTFAVDDEMILPFQQWLLMQLV